MLSGVGGREKEKERQTDSVDYVVTKTETELESKSKSGDFPPSNQKLLGDFGQVF